ncbi:hypothetical protein C0584_05595 [Candidatus Parcubacteria bacterium]|nr:MAG: hypothetical protein C0584_05595 [Candidatus Parcubacteria bacterium]
MEKPKVKNTINFSNVWSYLSMMPAYALSGFYLMFFLTGLAFEIINEKNIYSSAFMGFVCVSLLVFAIIRLKMNGKDSEIFNILVWSGFIVFLISVISENFFKGFIISDSSEMVNESFAGVMSVFILAVLLLSFLFWFFIKTKEHIPDRFKKTFVVFCLIIGSAFVYKFINSIEDIANNDKISYFLVPSSFVIYINYFISKMKQNREVKNNN